MRKLSLLVTILFFISFQITAQIQWVVQTSGTTNTLYSVSAPNDNVVWAAGVGGTVIKSTNGGTNFTSVGGGAIGTADVYNIFAVDANNAWCTTSPGATFIYRTTNGGTTWTQVYTLAGGFIDAIWFDNANNGFAYGDPVSAQWVLIKTTDGGTTWTSAGTLAQVGTEAGWNNAMYKNGNGIWFGTNNSKVYYSSNGGANWVSQATTGVTNGYALWFNGTNGVVGNNGTIAARTTNSGTAWSTLAGLPSGTGNIAGVASYTYGGVEYWWMSRGTGVLWSVNGGNTWTSQYTATATLWNLTRSIAAYNLWAVGASGVVIKLVGPVPVELTSFNAYKNGSKVDLKWTTATEQNNSGFDIERKIDAGEWQKIGFREGKGTTTEKQSYSFTDDVKGVVAQKISYRLKQVDFNGAYEYSKEVFVDNFNPTEYAVEQNYPNPFNPSTSIKFQMKAENFVSLKVFNSLGQEVSTLVNEVRQVGPHQVEFNAKELGSGIYYAVLRVGNNEFTQTIKMNLMK